MVKLASKDLERTLADALKENEAMLTRLKIKNGSGHQEEELRKLREKTQQEYIDTVISTLRIELLSEIQKASTFINKSKSQTQKSSGVNNKFLEQQFQVLDEKIGSLRSQLQETLNANSHRVDNEISNVRDTTTERINSTFNNFSSHILKLREDQIAVDTNFQQF